MQQRQLGGPLHSEMLSPARSGAGGAWAMRQASWACLGANNLGAWRARGAPGVGSSMRGSSGGGWRAGGGRSRAAAAAADTAPPGGRPSTLMIVESPTKATKIQKFLGSDYRVVASYGHVRDLVNRQGSVDPSADFALSWRVLPGGEARLGDIAAASGGARRLVLATDPDREGEAISWHIVEELQRRGVLPRPGLTLERVTFTEVTHKAVTEALQQPRQLSSALISAYLARRALDFLVGFTLSPLLWRRIAPVARSAGRVQSVALRLLCEREDEVQLHKPEEYWTITANLSAPPAPDGAGGGGLAAQLVEVDGRRLAKMTIRTQAESDELVARLWQQQGDAAQAAAAATAQHEQEQQAAQQARSEVLYSVSSVRARPHKRKPPPPLVTSSLQQLANQRLGFSASKTMQLAQQLYEGADSGEGLITYMRTDGVNLSPEAVEALRDVIGTVFGPAQLPSVPWQYKTRAKNAQEAHEAIRPTNPALLPDQAAAMLTPDQARLYGLIWRRAVASQMNAAELEQVTVELLSPCGALLLRSSGSCVTVPGWRAAWALPGPAALKPAADAASSSSSSSSSSAAAASQEEGDGQDGAAAGGDDGGRMNPLLQQLQEGQQLQLQQVLPRQRFTPPPPHYSEASMVATLEALGIGRPSTYAPIIQLLQRRGYAYKQGSSLVPTPLGRLLVAYLQLNFAEYVDVNFTARVETLLDEVSAGGLAWKQLLADYWGPLEQTAAAAARLSKSQVFDQLEARLEPFIFPTPPGSDAAAAAGERGGSEAAAAAAVAHAAAAAAGSRTCPVCGGRLVLKPSRVTGGFIGCSNHDAHGCTFGRPLWPDVLEAAHLSDEEEEMLAAAAAAAGAGGDAAGAAAAVVIGDAKLLGNDPASGQPVFVKRGPFGLYVQRGSDGGVPASNGSNGKAGRPLPPVRASLPRGLGWSDTSLDDALALLALPRTLGTHPDSGEPVLAGVSRFGPYLRHRSLSAGLPKGLDPAAVTMEEALALIGAKEQRLRARGRDPYQVKPGKQGRGKAAARGGAKRQRPVTGYTLFLRDMKGQPLPAPAAAALAGDGASVSGKRISLLAAAWRALSPQEQAGYNTRARELAAGAGGELAAAKGTGGEPAAAGAAAESGGGGGERGKGGGSRGRAGRATLQDASGAAGESGRRRTRRTQNGSSADGSPSGLSADEPAAAAPANGGRRRRVTAAAPV